MASLAYHDFQPDGLFQALADPAWLPHRLDSGGGALEMLRIGREERRRVTFLDEEYLADVRDRAVFPLKSVMNAASAKRAPIHFIFHSAFACSTLMTRVFDIPGTATSLSEPAILNEIAHRARRQQPTGPLLDTTLALLGRGFEPGETVVVKPSNVVNNLSEEMFALRPDAKALILYTPLRDFLFSVAKKGMFGRIWARRTFALLRGDGLFDAGFSEAETFAQTDLQIAAAAWLAHHGQFAAIVRRHPGRVRTLDSKTFLARKADSIAASGSLFGLRLDAAALAAGPAFARDAKETGRDFDAESHARARAALEEAHRDEIDMVVKWGEAVGEFLGIPMQLGAPLLR